MEKLNIIIPAYNEEKRIKKTLEEYCKFLRDKKVVFEILVILNNCKDNTLKVVQDAQKEFREINYLDFEEGGKGFAIIKGFEKSLEKNFELIGFVDADMATPPEAFYKLIKNIERNDGIIASRWVKGSIIKTPQNFMRKITSKGFNFVVRSFFLFQYKDTQCGAKLFKKRVIKKIVKNLSLTKWAFDVNLLYLCKKNNFKIIESPTIWEHKEDSKMENVGKVSFQMFSGVLRLRLINSPFEKILRPGKIFLKIADRIINK